MIGFAAFDDPVHITGHSSGECGIRLAAQMGALPIFGDVTLERASEAVGLLHDCHLAAIQSDRRSRALPYLDNLVWPRKVPDWIAAVGAKTAHIELGSPWENGYCEGFNARFRDELRNGENFYSLQEA